MTLFIIFIIQLCALFIAYKSGKFSMAYIVFTGIRNLLNVNKDMTLKEFFDQYVDVEKVKAKNDR